MFIRWVNHCSFLFVLKPNCKCKINARQREPRPFDLLVQIIILSCVQGFSLISLLSRHSAEEGQIFVVLVCLRFWWRKFGGVGLFEVLFVFASFWHSRLKYVCLHNEYKVNLPSYLSYLCFNGTIETTASCCQTASLSYFPMSHGLSCSNSSLCSNYYVSKCETILELGRTSWGSTSEENKWNKGMSDIRLQLVVKNDPPPWNWKTFGINLLPWRNYFNIQSPSLVMAASQKSDTSDKRTHFWTKASWYRLIKMQCGFESVICLNDLYR